MSILDTILSMTQTRPPLYAKASDADTTPTHTPAPHNTSTRTANRTLPVLTECAIIAGCVAITLPFWKALALGTMLAIACWPLQTTLCRWTGKRELSAGIITGIMLLCLIIPLGWAGTSIVQHMDDIRNAVADIAAHGLPAPKAIQSLPAGDMLTEQWNTYLNHPGLGQEVQSWFMAHQMGSHGAEAGAWVKDAIETIVFGAISMFVFLAEGHHVRNILTTLINRAIPGRGHIVVPHAYKSLRGIVVGLIMVGILEGGILAALGLCTHVPYALILLPAITLASIIPFCVIPTATIFGLWAIMMGHTTAGIVFIIIANVVLSIIDHVVRPKAIDGGTKIGFLPVLIGMLGGLHVFGLLGIFLGPSLISLANVIYLDRDVSPVEE